MITEACGVEEGKPLDGGVGDDEEEVVMMIRRRSRTRG